MINLKFNFKISGNRLCLPFSLETNNVKQNVFSSCAVIAYYTAALSDRKWQENGCKM